MSARHDFNPQQMKNRVASAFSFVCLLVLVAGAFANEDAVMQENPGLPYPDTSNATEPHDPWIQYAVDAVWNPRKLKYADAVFIQYTFKNITDAPKKISPEHIHSFVFSIQDKNGSIRAYEKFSPFVRLSPSFPQQLETIAPGETYVMYEALIVPPPELVQKNREYTLSWKQFQAGESETISITSFDNKRKLFRHSKDKIDISVTGRSLEEQMLFQKYLSGKFSLVDGTSLLYFVDAPFDYLCHGLPRKDVEAFYTGLSEGTLRDLLKVYLAVDRSSDIKNAKEKIVSYTSPDDAFWKWFDEIETIEKNFIALAIVKAYCSNILLLLPPEPQTESPFVRITAKERAEQKRRAVAEYLKHKDKFDALFSDWLKKLPDERGDISTLKDQIRIVFTTANSGHTKKHIEDVGLFEASIPVAEAEPERWR